MKPIISINVRIKLFVFFFFLLINMNHMIVVLFIESYVTASFRIYLSHTF